MVYLQLISHIGCFKRGGDGGGVLGANQSIDCFGANLYHEVVKISCYSITLQVARYYGSGNGGGGGGVVPKIITSGSKTASLSIS